MREPSNGSGFLRQALIATARQYHLFTGMLLVSVAAGAVIYAWPSLVLRSIVDGPLASGGQGLWKYAFLYLGAVLLVGLADFIREYGATVLGQRILLYIRTSMLARLRSLPMAYFLEVPAGDTLSRFTADIDTVNALFRSGIVSAIADLLKIAGLITALFYLSSTLGYVAVAALPVVYLLSDYFRRNIYNKQLVVRKRVADINTRIHEIYSGVKLIKVFGRERFFAERFEPLLEGHRVAMNGTSVYDAWFPCVMQTLRAAVIATALVISASDNTTMLSLGLSIGTIAAAADLFIRLFEPIEAVATEIQTIQQAMAGISRIGGFFAEPPDTTPGTQESLVNLTNEMAVEVQDVHFSYKQGTDVLRGASLVIPAGTKAAIAGRTGSGKTTLMNLVAGLYPPKSGKITIGGYDPFLLPPSVRRKIVGIVPQNVMVFNGSIYENITLRDDTISREQAEWAIRAVGLYDAITHLPEGMETVIGEGAYKLSYGQTQLLSLARAIVTDPPLLLLDELTSGLDTVTERQVLDAIRSISGSKTIITISHRLSGIIDADTVHIMERGRVMESGSPQSLAQKEGWYARYKRLEDNGWRIA